MSRVFLLCSLLFIEAHGSFVSYNRTYGRYTYILPLHSSTGGSGQVTYFPRINDSSGAQRWCSSHFSGSKLATITSETIQKNINDFIAGARQELKFSYLTDVRVGGKSQNGWRWINGKTLKGYDVSESSSVRGPYGALWEHTKRFDSGDHTVKLSYICQYSTNVRANCHVNESGRCYVVTNASVTWWLARHECIRERGDLASFDIFKDNKTMDEFVQKLSPVSNYRYWVGLKKETFWRWDENDHEMNYTNWRFGQTSTIGPCVTLYYPIDEYQEKGKWSASRCSDILPFICEIPALVATTEVMGSHAAFSQATVVALSICLAISMIIAVFSLAAFFIMKRRIGRAEASCPTIHDNKYSSTSAATSKTESKQMTGSNNNNKRNIYANCAKDKNSAKPSANASSGPQSTTKNSYVDDQQQQSTIYASVQDQGGSSGPRVKEDVTSSAAATDAGRLIYAEVEFRKQPTK